jgi:glycosidase/fibronectin type 3 domain-containing protein
MKRIAAGFSCWSKSLATPLTLAALLAACSPSPAPDATATTRFQTGRTSSALTSPYATMYLRGTMNGWGKTTPMALTANDVWQVTVALTGGTSYQYKYEVTGNDTWSTNWGQTGTSTASVTSGSAKTSGGNIYFTPSATGSYLFTFNDSAPSFSVALASVPAVPAGLTATGKSASQIDLTWTASSGATSYTISRATAANGTYTALTTQTGVTYSDGAGLAASTTYYYHVVASNNVGTSAAASVSAATLAAGAFTSQYPQMFVRGTMNSWGTTAMTLVANSTWQVAVSMAAGNGNQFKFDETGTWGALNWGDNGADGVANDQGGGNITYNAAVAGTYTIRFNDSTKAYSVTGSPPAAPTGLAAIAKSQTEIDLSWTAPAGATSYTIYRSTSATGTFGSIGTSTTAAFVNTGLSASTTYYYQVTGSNAAGEGAKSNTASTTTLAVGADVTPPTITPSVAAGSYTTTQTVTFTLRDDSGGTSTAYFTKDGTTPTTSSQVYTQGNASAGRAGAAQSVSATTTFNFLLVDAAGNRATASFAYRIGTSTALTDFRKESIYFLIISRFYDGDKDNNMHCWDDATAQNPDSDPCYRGDFKGLIAKLDYIKALGFSAIWITPVVENASGYDYHGYHALNFKKIDPRLLSGDTSYQSVIDAIHARGMKVIQDIVLNHTGNFGEENLFPLFTKNWSNIYNASNQAISINADTANALVNIDSGHKLPSNYSSLTPTNQYNARITAMKTDASDTNHIYHHEQSLQWEGYTVETGQIAGDCVDLDTENPTVASYLRDAYGAMVDAGVDGFRIDTVKHISRLTLNNEFFPQMTARGGSNFFMFGEVAALYENVVNSGIPAISPFFYTWKESKSYPWGDRVTNEASTQAHWNDNDTTNNLPSSSNAFLSGITYHAPDYSQSNNFHVIDFPMHWAFINAHNAFNMALSNDQLYNDSTWNVVYVASHDYSPDQAPQNERFSQPQSVWAENLDLEFTFRGIPALYNGDEIEFQKGQPIDVGNTNSLGPDASRGWQGTGRAYFGANLEGTVKLNAANDFGDYDRTGTTGQVATTLAYPLAVHVRELNRIRRGVPALQTGQYTTSSTYVPNNGGGIAFVRRYTSGGTDSVALVAISANATFANIPNGKYVDAVTGGSINVTNGSLTTTGLGAQGNMRVYVLNGSKLTDSSAQTYLK